MISSFGDRITEDLYHGILSKKVLKIEESIRTRAQRKLDILEYAINLEDISIPPSNNLEKLTGNLRGFYSIRVNDQYRIIFKWKDGNAFQVKFTDYH